jgi:hypothetical protein
MPMKPPAREIMMLIRCLCDEDLITNGDIYPHAVQVLKFLRSVPVTASSARELLAKISTKQAA